MNIKQLFRLLLIGALIPIPACASINSPIDGVVIDESTGKPIPGAFVIAQWVSHGSDGVGSRTNCRHVEVVQSNNKGRYRFPRTNVVGLGLSRLVFSYRAGYEWFMKGREPVDQMMSMRRFQGTQQERLDKILALTQLECGAPENYRIALIPLYKAMVEEARQLTQSDNSVKGFSSLRYSLDVLVIGYEAASDKLTKGEYER